MNTFETQPSISLFKAISFFAHPQFSPQEVQGTAKFWENKIKLAQDKDTIVNTWYEETSNLFQKIEDKNLANLLLLLEIPPLLPRLLSVSEMHTHKDQLQKLTEYEEFFQDRIVSQILTALEQYKKDKAEVSQVVRLYLLRYQLRTSPYTKLFIAKFLGNFSENSKIGTANADLVNDNELAKDIIQALEAKLLLAKSTFPEQSLEQFVTDCRQSGHQALLGQGQTSFYDFPESPNIANSYKKLITKAICGEFDTVSEEALMTMVGGIVNSSHSIPSLKTTYKEQASIFNAVLTKVAQLFEISDFKKDAASLDKLRRAFSSEISNLNPVEIKPFHNCIHSSKNQNVIWLDSPRIRYILQVTQTTFISPNDIVLDYINHEHLSPPWQPSDLFADEELEGESFTTIQLAILRTQSKNSVDDITVSEIGKFFYHDGKLILPTDGEEMERLSNRLKRYVAKNTPLIASNPLLTNKLVTQIQTIIDTYYINTSNQHLDLIQQLCRRLYNQMGRILNTKDMSSFDMTNMRSPRFGFAFPIDIGFSLDGHKVNTNLAAKATNNVKQTQLGEESEAIVSSMFDYLPGHLLTFRVPAFSELDTAGLDVFALRLKDTNKILDTSSKTILILYTLALKYSNQQAKSNFGYVQAFKEAKNRLLKTLEANQGMLGYADVFPEFSAVSKDIYKIRKLDIRPKSSSQNPHTKEIYTFTEFEINPADISFENIKETLLKLDFAKFVYLFSKDFQIQGIQVKSSSYNLQQFVSRGLHIGTIYPPFNQTGKLDVELLSNLVTTMFCY